VAGDGDRLPTSVWVMYGVSFICQCAQPTRPPRAPWGRRGSKLRTRPNPVSVYFFTRALFFICHLSFYVLWVHFVVFCFFRFSLF